MQSEADEITSELQRLQEGPGRARMGTESSIGSDVDLNDDTTDLQSNEALLARMQPSRAVVTRPAVRVLCVTGAHHL